MNVTIENVATVDLINNKNGSPEKKLCAVRFNNSDGISVTVVFDENSVESVRKTKHALDNVENFLVGEV